MKVKELADLARTTVRTVRYYHQINLLPLPETRYGWRDYGLAHVARLLRVRWLVNAGVPLAQVQELLAVETLDPDDGAGRGDGASPDHVEFHAHGAGLDRSGGHSGTPTPSRAQIAADLHATLAGIDQRLQELQTHRQQLRGLLQTVESGRSLTPIPEPLERMYQGILARISAERARRMVLAERDLLEMACYRMELPDDVVELAERLTDADLDEIAALFECIQQITQERPLDAEEQLRAVAVRAVTVFRRVCPDLLDGWVQLFAEGEYLWAWKAFTLAFPDHYLRVYAEVIAEEFGLELTDADRRALAEGRASEQPGSEEEYRP